MLEEKILGLKKDLITYASLIEIMVRDGIEGLLKKDAKLLQDILNVHEPRANAWEVEVDEKCTSIIAQYQPRAKELRTVLMILGMNRDLERMGDHAVNIAQSALYLIEHPQVKPFVDLPRMSEIVNAMLRDSITAFIQDDSALARDVCQRDDLVDDLRTRIKRELITYMTADPATIERALHITRISANLERIADLATNIGEDVMYMVEGLVIKHHLGEEKEKQ
jgi:phosphate transport system protein